MVIQLEITESVAGITKLTTLGKWKSEMWQNGQSNQPAIISTDLPVARCYEGDNVKA
jgi:hypothetical protein